eukprot:165431_1
MHQAPTDGFNARVWALERGSVLGTFLKWKIQTQRSRNSIICSKIHNLSDRNKQISDKTKDLEETIRNYENEYNQLSEKMNTLKDEKQMYDKQLAGLQSELDKHSSELNVIDATNRILSIASECVSVLHSEVLHLWRSNPVDPCQLLPGKSIDQAENILSNMSAQNLLVSWVNFHAKRGNHELEIGNFASDLKDSEAFKSILNSLFPQDAQIKSLSASDLENRARIFLDICEKYVGNDVTSLVSPANIVAYSHPDLVAALIGQLFSNHFALHFDLDDLEQNVLNRLAKMKEKLSRITSREILLEEVDLESIQSDLRSVYDRAENAIHRIDKANSLWKLLKNRVMKFVVDNILIGRLYNEPAKMADVRLENLKYVAAAAPKAKFLIFAENSADVHSPQSPLTISSNQCCVSGPPNGKSVLKNRK